jgi:hypothetical protein
MTHFFSDKSILKVHIRFGFPKIMTGGVRTLDFFSLDQFSRPTYAIEQLGGYPVVGGLNRNGIATHFNMPRVRRRVARNSC